MIGALLDENLFTSAKVIAYTFFKAKEMKVTYLIFIWLLLLAFVVRNLLHFSMLFTDAAQTKRRHSANDLCVGN